MSPEDRFASSMFDGEQPDACEAEDHEGQIESAFAEIAALNKALVECQIERDALRDALRGLRAACFVKLDTVTFYRLTPAMRAAERALESRPADSGKRGEVAK